MNSLKINVSPTESEDRVAQQSDDLRLKKSITKPHLMGNGLVHIQCHVPRNVTHAKKTSSGIIMSPV
jgi:hypothetical protein